MSQVTCENESCSLSFKEIIMSHNTQSPAQKQKYFEVACLDSPTEHFHALLPAV